VNIQTTKHKWIMSNSTLEKIKGTVEGLIGKIDFLRKLKQTIEGLIGKIDFLRKYREHPNHQNM